MIIVKLQGGLGNQLFQYSFAYALAHRFKIKCYFDTSHYGYANSRRLELELLGIKVNTKNILSRIVNYSGKNILIKWLQIYFSFIVEKQLKFTYSNIILGKNVKIYFDGYWQSQYYFINHRNELLKHFVFPSLKSRIAIELMASIKSQCSIAVHVRRGDYLTDTSGLFASCEFAYYEAAFKIFSTKYPLAVFFVFSDDLEWCRQNFQSNITKFVFVSGTDRSSSVEDLYLMSICQHNIIANSSYSWWAAWLNQNPNKFVVAPKKWFKDNSVDTSDLYPPEWILI